MSVVRSLLFYAVFYPLSAIYVTLAVLASYISRRALRVVVHGWTDFHRWCVRHLLGVTVRIEGERHEGPVLYAIKHESFFEAIDAPTLLSLPAPFAKAELFRIPGWGFAARRYGVVEVARTDGAKALRSMVASAKELSQDGRPLVIFPEGTRVRHGERRALQSGFAGLYKLLRLPVVPVAVDSGPLYHRPWKRSGTITYRFGEPIPPGLDRADIERRVLDAINALNDSSPTGGRGPHA